MFSFVQQKFAFKVQERKQISSPFNSMIFKVLELLLEQWLLCSSRAVEGPLHPPLHPLVHVNRRLDIFVKWHKAFFMNCKNNVSQYRM